jgi:Dna[CI] antecedent, DciA
VSYQWSEPRAIGDAVRRELSRFGPASGMAPLVEAWSGAVGPDIARNAWPARLGRDGSMRVHTRDAVWAFELAARAEEIRERLGELAPPRLIFVAGPVPEPSLELVAEPSRRGVEPSLEHRSRAASLVRGIGDEELRKIVAKTVALSLAAADSGRSF